MTNGSCKMAQRAEGLGSVFSSLSVPVLIVAIGKCRWLHLAELSKSHYKRAAGCIDWESAVSLPAAHELPASDPDDFAVELYCREKRRAHIATRFYTNVEEQFGVNTTFCDRFDANIWQNL